MTTPQWMNGSDNRRSMGRELPGSTVCWNLLRRRYRWLAAGVITGLVLATAYCLWTPPVYECSTQILVVKKQPTLPARASDGQKDFEQAIGEDLLATHMLILRSPRVVEDALRRHQLDQRTSLREALDQDQDMVEYVTENLRVTRGGEGQGRLAHVITLQFRHGSAEDCAAVVKAVVEAYRDFLDTDLSSPVKDALTLIRQAKDEVHSALQQTRGEYQRFREATPLFWKGNERWNVHQARQETLDRALAEIRLQIVDARARLETLGSLQTSSSDDTFDWLAARDGLASAAGATGPSTSEQAISSLVSIRQPQQAETARAEFSQLLALRLQKRELLGDFGADHPRVQRAQESLEEMEGFLRQKRSELARGYKHLVNSELQELQRRETEVARMMQAEEEAAKTLVRAELKDEVLRNELDRNQRLFDSVVARLDEINLAKDYGGFATETIAPVKLGQKVSPLPALALPVGLFIGLCLGLVAAVTADLASLPNRVIGTEADQPIAPASSRVWQWTPYSRCDDVLEANQGGSPCPR